MKKKEYILTNYQSSKKNCKAVDSDHMTIYMDLNIKYDKLKSERQDIYNLKESEGQQKFRIFTTETDEFSKCFNVARGV